MAIKEACFGDPLGAAIACLLIIPACLCCGMVEAAKPSHYERVTKARTILSAVLSEHKIEAQEKMRGQFLSVARAQTVHPFVVIDDQGPTTLEEEINYYASMAERGVDTILEMSLQEVGVSPKVDYYEVVLTLRIRLTRTAEGELFYDETLRCGDLKKRRFLKWAENDGKPLEEEINSCYRYLAKKTLLRLL